MKQLLKYSGIFLIFLAVILLGIYVFTNPTGNALLVVSAVLLIGGLVGYIVINKIIR